MAAPPAVLPGAAGGAPPGPEELDELQMEILIQKAMYDLMQKPIIPDSLVFICSCLYLFVMLTTLTAGAIYFTIRLQPPPLPPPPEETETTGVITDAFSTTTVAPKVWDERNGDRPLVCVVGFQLQAPNKSRDFFEQLEGEETCNFYAMKETFAYDSGELVLAGSRGKPEADKLCKEQYGDKIREKITPAMVCCSVKSTDVDFMKISTMYLKLMPNDNMNQVVSYIDDFMAQSETFLEVGESEVKNLTADVIGRFSFIIVRSSSVTYDALVQLKVAPLANYLPDMLAVMRDATSSGDITPTKYCALFTVSALQATISGPGAISRPGEPVSKVTAVKQSEVCRITANLQNNTAAGGVSLFRPGSQGIPYLTFDRSNTIGFKVEEILRSKHSTCIVAYDVQNDDCPDYELTKTMQRAYDKTLT